MRILGKPGQHSSVRLGAGGTGSRSTVRHGGHYQFATNTHVRRDLVEHLPGGGITFETTEITGEGVVYQNNGVTVTAFLVDHGVVKTRIRIPRGLSRALGGVFGTLRLLPTW